MRNFIALDLETYLIKDNQLPKPVCASYAYGDGSMVKVVGNNESGSSRMDELNYKIGDLFRYALENDFDIVLHNGAAFDLPVLYKYYPNIRDVIIETLDKDLIRDTKIREQLYQLSTTGEIVKPRGHYSLAGMAKRYLAKDIDAWKKGDNIWRLRYSELDGTPASEYPKEAYEYCILDVNILSEVYKAQSALQQPGGPGSMNSEGLQVKAAFVLALMTDRGMSVDTKAVADLQRQAISMLNPAQETLLKYDMAYFDKKGILCKRQKEFESYLLHKHPECVRRLPITDEDIKAAERKCKVEVDKEERKAIRAYIKKSLEDESLPKEFPNDSFPDIYAEIFWKNDKPSLKRAYRYDRTLYSEPLGNIDTSEDSLSLYPEDSLIQARLQSALAEKILGTYCRNIAKQGTTFRASYDVLKNTGRTSSFIQTMPKDKGIRELFIPRPGYKIWTIDISGHEGLVIAQVMHDLGLGDNLLNYLNSGSTPQDYHALLGHKWHEYRTGEAVSIEEFVKRKTEGDEQIKKSRNQAKAPGLSIFGGGSDTTIATISKGEISPEQVKAARMLYYEAVPEAKLYLSNKGWVGQQKCTDDRMYTYAYTTSSGRHRTYCTYSACANGRAMQSEAADSSKESIWTIWKALEQPLISKGRFYYMPWGSLLFHIHDENGGEIYDHCIPEGMEALCQAMCLGLRKILPDVRIVVEFGVMDRWTKNEKEHIYGGRAWLEPDGEFYFETQRDARASSGAKTKD